MIDDFDLLAREQMRKEKKKFEQKQKRIKNKFNKKPRKIRCDKGISKKIKSAIILGVQ